MTQRDLGPPDRKVAVALQVRITTRTTRACLARRGNCYLRPSCNRRRFGRCSFGWVFVPASRAAVAARWASATGFLPAGPAAARRVPGVLAGARGPEVQQAPGVLAGARGPEVQQAPAALPVWAATATSTSVTARRVPTLGTAATAVWRASTAEQAGTKSATPARRAAGLGEWAGTKSATPARRAAGLGEWAGTKSATPARRAATAETTWVARPTDPQEEVGDVITSGPASPRP